MSTSLSDYDSTVETVSDYLARADDLDGFVFAVSENGEDLNATIGRNEAAENTLWLDRLLGMQLLAIARTHDVDPARLGHMAVEFALENIDE